MFLTNVNGLSHKSLKNNSCRNQFQEINSSQKQLVPLFTLNLNVMKIKKKKIKTDTINETF